MPVPHFEHAFQYNQASAANGNPLLNANGLRWETARLSWEGVTLGEVRDGKLHGTGWNMHTNREVPFAVDMVTGAHEGGGFQSK